MLYSIEKSFKIDHDAPLKSARWSSILCRPTIFFTFAHNSIFTPAHVRGHYMVLYTCIYIHVHVRIVYICFRNLQYIFYNYILW